MRKILHIDLNSFYASVECLLDESLVGKPVAVSGSISDRHGVVLAKNQQAKVLGIKTGMTIYQAKKLSPDLIVKSLKGDYLSLENLNDILELVKNETGKRLCSRRDYPDYRGADCTCGNF